MKNLNYKGKGEHSVNELELIINQQAEELHLFNSGQNQLNLSGVSQQRELLKAYAELIQSSYTNHFFDDAVEESIDEFLSL